MPAVRGPAGDNRGIVERSLAGDTGCGSPEGNIERCLGIDRRPVIEQPRNHLRVVCPSSDMQRRRAAKAWPEG